MTKPGRKLSQSTTLGIKVDNAAGFAAKADIRAKVLECVGPERAAVLDCYAGSGKMHRAVWANAASYAGCDERFFFDRRTCFVCDNRVLLRAIDLNPFNIFDLDAYGSPWEQALIIAARRRVKPGERIGLTITEGSSINLRFGKLATALSEISGIPPRAAGAARVEKEVISLALLGMAKRMNSRIARRWEATGRTGARVAYVGCILEGLG